MSLSNIETHELRKVFSKIPSVLEIPHLLDIQVQSYNDFLQADIPEDKRKDEGLEAAFKAVFPIEDYNEKASLEYIKYRLDTPKYEESECRLKGYTYVAPLYVTFRLVIWDTDEESDNARTIRDVKEQEVYFGEVPIMTSNGSFIVNGTERVIVTSFTDPPVFSLTR